MDTEAYITRQDIVNFPFPYKLWIVVNLEFCDFLRWNRDGTVILLDLISLEDHLNSYRSIFKIKNCSVFLDHLDEFKFERLNAKPEAGEDLLLQYKNENFQRHRLDLLAKIRRHTYQLIGEVSKNKENFLSGSETSGNSVIKSNSEQATDAYNRVAERMLGDLCFMFHGGLSKIHTSRLRFQTILNFQNETRLLEQKIKASDEYNDLQRRRKSDPLARSAAGVSAAAEEDHVIELPVDLFENPHDSVLHLDEDFRPEYAGYYGNCSKEQITNFFGDYLPMYEDGSMEVKKIVADNSNTHKNGFNSYAEANNKSSYNTNVNKVSGILTSIPMAQRPIINFNFSSGLEPIFKTEEDQENINPESINVPQLNAYNMDNETEILMEEFIKFKGTSNESFANAKEDHYDIQQTSNKSLTNTTAMKNEEYQNCDIQQKDVTKQFPLMPAAVKMEIEEDTVENEANFRNFFSQYRASLNLLYERH